MQLHVQAQVNTFSSVLLKLNSYLQEFMAILPLFFLKCSFPGSLPIRFHSPRFSCWWSQKEQKIINLGSCEQSREGWWAVSFLFYFTLSPFYFSLFSFFIFFFLLFSFFSFFFFNFWQQRTKPLFQYSKVATFKKNACTVLSFEVLDCAPNLKII